jgi:hypothetical protein
MGKNFTPPQSETEYSGILINTVFSTFSPFFPKSLKTGTARAVVFRRLKSCHYEERSE